MFNKDQRTDPRVLRTHALLREALFSLMYEKSFEAITIQDITERATLNRGTFYLHYSGKNHLLEQSITDIFQDLTDSLAPIRSLSPGSTFDEQRLTRMFEIIFNHIGKHYNIYRFMLTTHDIGQFRVKLMTSLSNLIYQDPSLKFRVDHDSEVPSEMLVHYEVAALVGIITWWLENNMQYSTQFMAAKMTHLAMTGPFNSARVSGETP